MAGEWIPIDTDLKDKIEFDQIVGATGESREVVVGRLVLFWSWAFFELPV